MHDQAMAWVAEHATRDPVEVLDIGGRDINGSPRPLFPNAISYTVLDNQPGANVDIQADAAAWEPDGRRYDVVVCTEVLEHAPDWRQILATAYRALRDGGRLIVTCAGPGRGAHSAVYEGPLLAGEFYENLTEPELYVALLNAGFADPVTNRLGLDLRAVATK